MLVLTVERAVSHRRLSQELKRLRSAVASSARDSETIGESQAFRKAYGLIERVADSDISVRRQPIDRSPRPSLRRAIRSWASTRSSTSG